MANCQIGVSLTYAGQGVAWPYAMNLFIPPSWDDLEDPHCVLRRQKTRMPPEARYREKWQMALEMIDLARQAGVPHWGVAADAGYGNVAEFRRRLAEWREWYVVGVNANTEVFLAAPVLEDSPAPPRGGRPRKYPRLAPAHPGPVKVAQLGQPADEEAWEHLELRRASRGAPLVVEAVSRRVWPAQGYRQGRVQEEVWLLIERRWQGRDSFELRYYFSNMPQEIPTLEMVRLFHERYWIEQGYQQLKEELGLDHHEGRSWIGWHRHVLLVFLAFGCLTQLRLQEKKRRQQSSWMHNWSPPRIPEKGTSN